MSISELRRPILQSNNQYRSYSVQDNVQNEGRSFLCRICQINLQIHEVIFLVILLLLFFAGLCIGVFLLVTEGQEWKDSRVYNLTSRELWDAHVASSTMPKLKLPVQRVLFLPTNNCSTCNDEPHYTKLMMQELQFKHMNESNQPDIIYNFVVSTDGTIFEGRGWNFQTSLSNDEVADSTIAVAFLGNFLVDHSVSRQSQSVNVFFKKAVLDGKLEHCIITEASSDQKLFDEMIRNIRESLSVCENHDIVNRMVLN